MQNNSFEVNETSVYKRICGYKDKNLKQVESILGIELIPRGNTIIIQGDNSGNGNSALSLLYEYVRRKDPDYELGEFEVRYIANSVKSGKDIKIADLDQLKIYIPETRKTVMPRTVNQGNYLLSISNTPITFGIGPAGTGKTYLAVVSAIDHFLKGKVERIVLTRPAVEAGENLGFLPGDLIQKINPYLKPLYDALFELMSPEKVMNLIEKGYIEIAPLAYMRGRTLNNSYIILDEAQNTTASQMKMFLTRLGANSKIVISGDVTQIDLERPEKSGLLESRKILQGVKGINFINFSKEDISRHPVVEKIVAAYESAGYR